jgi:hypothetical protein
MMIPMALVFVILFNLCACWTRLMRLIGFEEYTFSEVFEPNLANEGVSILE